MISVGIIAEYNPLHNGHLYHLNKVKEMFNEATVIVVLGGNFLQRGEISVLDKWDKTTLALEYGADLVIELPFPFATQAADIFAQGAVNILNNLKVDYIVFGSECNDVTKLTKLAKTMNTLAYQKQIKKYLDLGLNYPLASGKALELITNNKIDAPNDILGLAYIREIINIKAKIKPITIQRTNNYHDKVLKNKITSATSIREGLKKGQNIKKYVPDKTYQLLKKETDINNYFDLLKYQIVNNAERLKEFLGVDEGIEYKIIANINKVNSVDELILKIKSKRYSYNRISRMLIHILLGFTKDQAKKLNNITYIRVLGFNKKGQEYLKRTKKDINLPIITTYSKYSDNMLKLEEKASAIYYLIKQLELKEEYKQKVVIK